MSGYANFEFTIDRAGGIFNFGYAFQIDGYIDPETAEYFGDTAWSVTYVKDSGVTWSDGGNVVETRTGIWELGLEGGDGLKTYTLTFSAMNTFTTETIAATWRIFNVAYETDGKRVLGTTTEDIFIGGFGGDHLKGLAGNDRFDGGNGNDILFGGEGDDWLDGGAGRDRLIGGNGDDVFLVNSKNDRVVELVDGGDDAVQAKVSFTLSANIEQLFLMGAASINGRGNDTANWIYGNDEANSLFGVGGDDHLAGGAGADKLFGGEGADTLDGGAGEDRLQGGAGDDIYIVDTTSDKIIELDDQGIDTVRTAAGMDLYTLGTNAEILETLGNASFHGIGNELRNDIFGSIADDVLEGKGDSDALYGGAGNDRLIGGVGADELRGGDGIDTASYEDALSRVEVSLATGDGTVGDAEGDWLLGIENLAGSAFDDVLIGNILANQLYGGAGADTLTGGSADDVLIGGAGADILDGGDDIDTVSYAGSTVAVTVNLATQTASGGDAAGDILSGFENATGGDGGDTLTGSATANMLSGGGGSDTIRGGGGDDVIHGGTGGDWLDGESGVNTLNYAGSSAGISVDLYTMVVSGGDAAGDQVFNFDNVTGSSMADALFGNDNSNVLVGGDGTDTIDGRGGDDWISGGAGADVLTGGGGVDTLSYAGSTNWSVIIYLSSQTATSGDAQGDTISGFENAEGGERGDYLVGDSGDNWLSGRAGLDTLDGGIGDDVLVGGSDADTFKYGFGYQHDTVTDFVAGTGSGDRIVLSFASAFDTFSEVMAVAQTSGDSVIFDFGGGDLLQLDDVAIGSLTSGDFVFA